MDDVYEYEAKFVDGNNISQVSEGVFNNVKVFLDENITRLRSESGQIVGKRPLSKKIKPTFNITLKGDNTRYIKHSSSKITKMTKTRIKANDDVHRPPRLDGVKYTLSRESKESETEYTCKTTGVMVNGIKRMIIVRVGTKNDAKTLERVRHKDRTRYNVINYKLFIDLTEVITVEYTPEGKPRDPVVSYEVEIETEQQWRQEVGESFNMLVRKIHSLIPSRPKVHTKDIINTFNSYMGKSYDKTILTSLLAKPRDLRLHDLTINPKNGIINNYHISVKADGKQGFLLFEDNKVWLLQTPNVVIYIGDHISDKKMIIAGEVITQKDIKENVSFEKDLFIPFDIPFYEKRLEDVSYEDRLNLISLNLIDPKLEFETIQIHPKKFYKITSIDTFYDSMNKVMLDREIVIYKEDGIIITPNTGDYITPGQKTRQKPGYNRNPISKSPDVCKWKPPDRLTIDLLCGTITDEPEEFNPSKQTLSLDTLRDMDEMSGPGNNPLSLGVSVNNNGTWRSESLSNYDNIVDIKFVFSGSGPVIQKGDIVEFAPVVAQTGEKTVTMVPIRVRKDREHPNSLDVVKGLYDLIINPIQKDTLTGNNTTLMRKFHNRIKSEAYRIETGNHDNILIDIGSGKGGDIMKWSKAGFTKVMAIEPNKTNVNELYRRLQDYKDNGGQTKITVVNAEGQSPDIDLKGFLNNVKPGTQVYVSFMFSLTFFDSKNVSVIKRINEILLAKSLLPCKILFTTVDGNKLNALIQKSGVVEQTTTELDLNTIKIVKKNNASSISITISDSQTVQESQTENLVFVDDIFNAIDYQCVVKKYASDRRFADVILSKGEQAYTNTVEYGVCEYRQNLPTPPTDRLQVSASSITTVTTTKTNGDVVNLAQRVGDDTAALMPHFPGEQNVYRISTIPEDSFYHSILKLKSNQYLESDYINRIKIVNQVKNFDKQELANKIGINIQIINKHNTEIIYATDTDTPLTLFLYHHTDDSYEPLVTKASNNQYCTVFE